MFKIKKIGGEFRAFFESGLSHDCNVCMTLVKTFNKRGNLWA